MQLNLQTLIKIIANKIKEYCGSCCIMYIIKVGPSKFWLIYQSGEENPPGGALTRMVV